MTMTKGSLYRPSVNLGYTIIVFLATILASYLFLGYIMWIGVMTITLGVFVTQLQTVVEINEELTAWYSELSNNPKEQEVDE